MLYVCLIKDGFISYSKNIHKIRLSLIICYHVKQTNILIIIIMSIVFFIKFYRSKRCI
ncbi:hypothetical protein HanIR_Chr05g0251471 [Helianthus annuus]|nr:hypothetical protein HanIR_Chr05g0251471 [Helianthus annuus]